MSDIDYWKNFYENNNVINEPSDFCKFVMEFLDISNNSNSNIKTILDCGCGNGRDTYFLGNVCNVTGIDTSSVIPTSTQTCTFEESDFCNYDKSTFDLIYSRFTFHSITNEQQETFIKSIEKPGTILCIETRSDKSELDNRHHGDDHYRNFTNIHYICDLLTKNNFFIMHMNEDKDFAVYEDENPICIRVICRKQ